MDEFGDEHFQNTSMRVRELCIYQGDVHYLSVGTNFDLDYLENISTRNETAVRIV